MQYQPSAPVWVHASGETIFYARQRDEMPGYRYAITEQLKRIAVDKVPDIVLPKSLTLSKAATYQWFQETVVQSSAPALPPSWFAWGVHRGQATVVYSEQCLAPAFCLKLQRWPVQENAF